MLQQDEDVLSHIICCSFNRLHRMWWICIV